MSKENLPIYNKVPFDRGTKSMYRNDAKVTSEVIPRLTLIRPPWLRLPRGLRESLGEYLGRLSLVNT